MMLTKTTKLRDTPAVWWGGALAGLMLVALVLTWVFLVGPPPPKQFRFAAGAPGGAYVGFAAEYKRVLASAGVRMEVVETHGSVDNLRLLRDPGSGVVAGLVQGGIVQSPTDADGLVALGSVAREPLWLFYRSARVVSRVMDLAGRRIAVGEEGSGTRPVAMQILAANKVNGESGSTELLAVGGDDAVRALRDQSVDAAFFVASIESPRIQTLLRDPSLKLMSFDRVDAYLQRFGWLTKVILPRGMVSLAADLPAKDVTLLAPSTMLVVRRDIHPDLIPLLLEAAKRTHGDGDLLTKAGVFPSSAHLDLPLDKDARRYLDRGPGWLYRVMPYRLAVQVDRLKILLLPLITLLIPLIKIAPPVYRWRIRARVFRWYGILWELDMRLSSRLSMEEMEACERTLMELQHDLERVRVPLSYMAEYYDLRMHVDLVRRRLDGLASVSHHTP